MEEYKKAKKIIDSFIEHEIISKSQTKYIGKILKQVFDGGKRLRPIISLQISKSINKSNNTNYNILTSYCMLLKLVMCH